MNRPNLLARAVSLIAGVVAVVVVVLLASGGGSYVLKLKMANATGLQTGAQVFLGGVPVGSVSDLEMDRPGNAVIVTLDLEKGKAHVGQGVKAAVIATNLLGTKSVQLAPGNRNEPLPSGTTLPESATSIPTDLDQVVDVLNQPTRVDLQLMLTEAGVAVAGRKADVSAILRQFPLSLQAATKLFRGLADDNHSLADFIANSNAFITRVNAKGPELKRLLASAAGAARTFSDQAGPLAKAVQEGPYFFRVVRSWFAGAAKSATELTPIAAQLAQTAGPLSATLQQIKPFAAAAVPTLNRAAQVAPTLSQLAEQATPILKQAVPTLGSLSNIARLSQPLSSWIGLSSQDLFSIFDNWSHAIQFRDGISHIFNGDVYLNPEIVLSAANKGASAKQKAQNLLDLAPSLVNQLGLGGAVAKARAFLNSLGLHLSSPTPASKPSVPTGHGNPTPSGPSSSGKGGSGSSPGSGSGLSGLGGQLGSGLGHLLGGVLGAVTGKGTTGASGTTTTTPPAGSGSGRGLSGLLDYLLGK
ncbi:MAG: MlaD family protein [Terriglobales bacterium]